MSETERELTFLCSECFLIPYVQAFPMKLLSVGNLYLFSSLTPTHALRNCLPKSHRHHDQRPTTRTLGR